MAIEISEVFTAIRESKVLGRGSCSMFDECFSDDELREDIEEMLNGELKFRSVAEVVKFYERIDRAEREQELL